LCAYASNFLIPARFAASRKATGETDGLALVGLLFPRGAVTPQATCSPLNSVACTPL
jgi:hypothetical protein